MPLDSVTLDKDAGEKIKNSAKETKLFCVVRFYEPNFLQEVINSGERFLIAVFQNGEVVMPYNNTLERFLRELIGLEINDLIKISEEVCAFSLHKKLKSLLSEGASIKEGNSELINMMGVNGSGLDSFEDYINGDILDRVLDGIYFQNIVPEGFMAIKQEISIDKRNAKMLIAGRLFRDYKKFYSLIKE